MSDVGQIERKTQDRVVALFQHRLGYEYLGNWGTRAGNANIETTLLTQNLKSRGYDDTLVTRALDQLGKAAAVGAGHGLYEANREVYGLLRYGVKVQAGVGEPFETVWLIDWRNPEANHFAIAEEVTVAGQHIKRPDVVLYVNGLALATLELKRSKVAVSEGIRQTIGNQRPEFIHSFFSTVQFVFAGNDVEGLRYAVIDTPEKYWLEWKEPSEVAAPLDRGLLQLCGKQRLLELVHDFIVFDTGWKKAPRHNQFFGVKAAQERIAEREGGIIWHTQGSGKSLTMVWLAKWIRENQPDARVLLITDRTELDDQIEKVFLGVNEQIYRTKSGADLIAALNTSEHWLICALIHKFRGTDNTVQTGGDATAEFIKELRATVPKDFHAQGNIFVFVDEAHRTQSGAMHEAMKQLLPGAMFIGFTGTPLLKADKATSIETFGKFIHTYKFDEAVTDGVVLDLRYEARHIDQQLTSPEQIDRWFEVKTQGMTDLSKAELKKRWGTIQKVLTSKSRAEKIVTDIMFDMDTKPRLIDGRGNAMLVGSSIYQACKFYDMFVAAGFRGKCAIVTSYTPNAGDVAKDDAGAGDSERRFQYETYRRMLADYFSEPADKAATPAKVEQFEQAVKKQFRDDPGQMRLLIVVDKLLTGFDAPSATYLYIDKKMRDHGLFQAICRVNRLDGDDKDYGYIVDYQDLFNSLESAITDYTSGALDGYEKTDIDGLLTDRIAKAREDLDDTLERVRALVEPVAPPKNTLQYQQYFCALEPGNADQVKANEPKRVELYKSIAALTRAYGNLANEMAEAGYTAAEADAIRREIAHYVDVRAEVKLGAGEDIDFTQYEAGMRFLLDTYIQAGASQVVADFADTGLIELIVQHGSGAIDTLPPGIKNDPEAVAETIANNIRQVIVEERALNPKYYDSMSALLDALIDQHRRQALDYQQYLAKLLDTATKLGTKSSDTTYPQWADNGARRALIDFGFDDPATPIQIDTAILTSKPHGWVGHRIKEKRVKQAVRQVLPPGFDRLDELFELIKARDEYH
ncbi:MULTISPECIES: HsdR family type I site-specific deoxyribonuclease [Rhodococcus]|uniref:type I restriction endonuclease subunit R n=1 Tax=Rhodococcus TaxID=1827 RepID=UPI00193BA6EC|nr:MULTISPECIES: HsdR family type I site-specific deoxyribonuclease [Rhodococcus]QRI79253.1 HsdR family type I site-specific deoxyribonuclease [Rhodococcus aetherivorans]QSE62438.1 HsdR family type I site-specific deoxyribonuclease [Rhodococcus sp. PSBB066]